jgi:hypothetical protein
MSAFRFSLTPSLLPSSGPARAAVGARPGRHELAKDVRIEFRRRTIAVAVAELAHESGCGTVSVLSLHRQARIAKSTLYKLFPGGSSEACSYASGLAVSCLVGRIDEAVAEKEGARRAEAAIGALLATAVEEPLMVELALVHARSFGEALPWRPLERVVDVLASALGTGPGAELSAHAALTAVATELRRPSRDGWEGVEQTLGALSSSGR